MLTPDEARSQEEHLRECSVAIPEGYTKCGIMWTPSGGRLYVTGPELPALFFAPGVQAWTRILEVNLDG